MAPALRPPRQRPIPLLALSHRGSPSSSPSPPIELPSIATTTIPTSTTTLPEIKTFSDIPKFPRRHIRFPDFPEEPSSTLLTSLYVFAFVGLCILFIAAWIRTVDFLDESQHSADLASRSTNAASARRQQQGQRTQQQRRKRRPSFNEWCRQRRLAFQRRASAGPARPVVKDRGIWKPPDDTEFWRGRVRAGFEEDMARKDPTAPLLPQGGSSRRTNGSGYQTFGSSRSGARPPIAAGRSRPRSHQIMERQNNHRLWYQDTSSTEDDSDPDYDADFLAAAAASIVREDSASPMTKPTLSMPTTRQRMLGGMRRPLLRTRSTDGAGRTQLSVARQIWREREMRRSWSMPVNSKAGKQSVAGVRRKTMQDVEAGKRARGILEGGKKGRAEPWGVGPRPLDVVVEEVGSVPE